MDKRNKISVNFNRNFLELYTFLKGKNNISAYVCEVLQNKMEEEKNGETLDLKIEKIIKKMLLDNSLDIKTTTSIKKDSPIKEEDKELIKSLF